MPMIPYRGPYADFPSLEETQILDTLIGMALDELNDLAPNDHFRVFSMEEQELLQQMHEKVKHALSCHPSFRDPSP